ncbi:lysylphosphatidylglycerol synthase domain-containing protein [Bacteroidota bacterium]
MKNKVKIFVSVLLIILSYGFIVYKILTFKELEELSFSFSYIKSINIIILICVVLFMPVNWGVESIKWKTLIDKIQILSFSKSLKIVFSGITVGIFTPNRVGDIGGRVLFLDKGNRTYGILATSIGSFAQFLTTIILGIIGFILFLFLFPEKTIINPIFNTATVIGLLLMLIFLIWFYINNKKIKPLLMKISFFKSRVTQIDYFSEMKVKALLKVLFLSIIRYIIFISQFYLLLIFFNININILQAYIAISLVYLFTTLVPTTTLVELGIRGSFAIFFIGIFSENALGIVLSTTLLWIINIAIPAIIGSFFLVKNNL